MHRATCARLGTLPALRFKRDGVWHHLTWDDYRREADLAAAGLIELGVAPGDRVATLSENRPEFLVADHAVMSVGAVPVPFYPTSAPAQIQFLLEHSGACGLFVSGAAQLAKVRPLLASLPALRFIVSFDAVEAAPGVPVRSWDALRHMGRQAGARAMDEVLHRESALDRDTLAALIYTSGTTGVPKGAMLTHGSFLFTTSAVAGVLRYNCSHVMVSWLPYCHVFARCVDHYSTTRMGMTLALAESPLTVMQTVAEIEPHYLTCVPRPLEKAWAQISLVPPEQRQREAKSIFGRRLDYLTSGGAPLPPVVGKSLCDVGVPIREGYGMTETSSIIAITPRESWRTGTVGPAIPGIEVRIAPDGEVLTRGPHLMKGYWRNPAATAEALVDGWLHTGDLGSIGDDGFLSITGRKKDLIITAGGENIAPVALEALLINDPFIEQAVAYGDHRPFVSAIIVPKLDRLAEAAREAGVALPKEGDVICDARLVAWFQHRVDALMAAVSQPERVKKIVLLNRALSLDREELTSTLKIRRSAIVEHYQMELDALYRSNAS
jgi:long-chain acyl-CoA synthetase